MATLRSVIKDMDLPQDAEVYVHVYGNADDAGPIPVSNIAPALLKKKVMVVQPNHGGQEYGYRLYKFIVMR